MRMPAELERQLLDLVRKAVMGRDRLSTEMDRRRRPGARRERGAQNQSSRERFRVEEKKFQVRLKNAREFFAAALSVVEQTRNKT